MEYIYFLTYVALFENKERHGNVELSINKKINQIEDLREIEKCLESENDVDSIVIINYQLLRMEEKNE